MAGTFVPLTDDDHNHLPSMPAGGRAYRELRGEYILLQQEYRLQAANMDALERENAELRSLISEACVTAAGAARYAAKPAVPAPQPGHEYVAGEELSPGMVGEG